MENTFKEISGYNITFNDLVEASWFFIENYYLKKRKTIIIDNQELNQDFKKQYFSNPFFVVVKNLLGKGTLFLNCVYEEKSENKGKEKIKKIIINNITKISNLEELRKILEKDICKNNKKNKGKCMICQKENILCNDFNMILDFFGKTEKNLFAFHNYKFKEHKICVDCALKLFIFNYYLTLYIPDFSIKNLIKFKLFVYNVKNKEEFVKIYKSFKESKNDNDLIRNFLMKFFNANMTNYNDNYYSDIFPQFSQKFKNFKVDMLIYYNNQRKFFLNNIIYNITLFDIIETIREKGKIMESIKKTKIFNKFFRKTDEFNIFFSNSIFDPILDLEAKQENLWRKNINRVSRLVRKIILKEVYKEDIKTILRTFDNLHRTDFLSLNKEDISRDTEIIRLFEKLFLLVSFLDSLIEKESEKIYKIIMEKENMRDKDLLYKLSFDIGVMLESLDNVLREENKNKIGPKILSSVISTKEDMINLFNKVLSKVTIKMDNENKIYISENLFNFLLKDPTNLQELMNSIEEDDIDFDKIMFFLRLGYITNFINRISHKKSERGDENE